MLFWLQVSFEHRDLSGEQEHELIQQVPNSPPEPKKDDKDSKSDKASLKSQGKRKSTNSDVIHEEHEIEIESSPLIKEPGPDYHVPTSSGSGTGDKEKEWRHSKLGRKVRGMENEEDMIKQRAEMRGLIEKKTYIGLVSQLASAINVELTRPDPGICCIHEARSSRRDWSFLFRLVPFDCLLAKVSCRVPHAGDRAHSPGTTPRPILPSAETTS